MTVRRDEALREGRRGLLCLAGAAEDHVEWLAPRNLNKSGHRKPKTQDGRGYRSRRPVWTPVHLSGVGSQLWLWGQEEYP